MKSLSMGAPARAALTRLAALLVAAMLAGCNLLPEVKDETAGWSPERLYAAANDELKSANYTRAIRLYETLEARYPYGRFAQQAMLESAYANYRAGETAAAVSAADRFIRTYPNHPAVDYAYYLKGLVHFREDQGLLGYFYELDLSERDPKLMKESFNAFRELAQKFPDSRYTEDAHARMRYLGNALAMHEVHVARYYLNRGAYLAAANRAQSALVNYPRTPANEDALDVLVRAYDRLGLEQLAEDSRRILKSTFPESRYLAEASQKPWWRFW
ncbi:MAG: outer membrane protein assembly factor BamD [Betaproteobacteria bacterium]|nr:MAG: outer membrane protein assembly factor BamD [Betaproteobacteria bacterium]